MCKFFSCIVTREGRIAWTLTESHEDIVCAIQKNDISTGVNRKFVRLECQPDGAGWKHIVDEEIAPAWWSLIADATWRAIEQIATLKRTAREQYEATKRTAREQYEATERTAWEQYEATERTAWEQYEATKRTAREQYEATKRTAREQYEAVILEVPGYVAL